MHTVISFQVFLSNTNNLQWFRVANNNPEVSSVPNINNSIQQQSFVYTYLYGFTYSHFILIIFKQIYLTHRYDLKRVRVYLGVMAMKGYSTLPRVPEQESHHQMEFSAISRRPLFWGLLLSLYWRYNQLILNRNDRAETYSKLMVGWVMTYQPL